MRPKYKSRALISFEGKCPMKCKHCYTYDLDFQEYNLDINSIVKKLETQSCDIFYVSQRYENFFDENSGYLLCNELYTKYHKDIFIITRSYLSDDMIHKLCCLSDLMRQKGNTLYLAVSVCANESYGITESIEICPTPIQRLSNLQRAHMGNIKTVLVVRPVFPNAVIPVAECASLISQFAKCIDSVVASGLIVTERILKQLQINKDALPYLPSGDSTYLADLRADEIRYVDVEDELQQIERQCSFENIPCFRHSMPALNYIASR